jgi:Zn-dependent protease with chaperone function
MTLVDELSFEGFIRDRKLARAGSLASDPHGYAYVSDRTTRAAFEQMKAVELAVAAGVRMFQHVGRGQLLGRAVKVGPRQFPRVFDLARQCADTLGIVVPTLYVVNNPTMNAATYGTNDDSFILIHSMLVDHLTDEELLSVIGHEAGHIHNSHVVYLTTLHYLSQMVGAVVRSVALPAMLALKAWSRRAEVTCDRAGLLCGRSLDASVHALCKLALGSQKLYEQLDVEAFIEQHDEARDSLGRLGELWQTHPFLPKRVLALRVFGESRVYREHSGTGSDGLSMKDVDEKVHDYVRVVG